MQTRNAEPPHNSTSAVTVMLSSGGYSLLTAIAEDLVLTHLLYIHFPQANQLTCIHIFCKNLILFLLLITASSADVAVP